jgi:hypothetical protein
MGGQSRSAASAISKDGMSRCSSREDLKHHQPHFAMPTRRFPKPWTVEPMPSGYRVAYVYGQPDGSIAHSDTRLTSDEARRISKLIARLPELVEGEGPQQGQEPA